MIVAIMPISSIPMTVQITVVVVVIIIIVMITF